MIRLNNSERDAFHLGFNGYRIPHKVILELAEELFSPTDYYILGCRAVYFRNPHAELIMLLKYHDVIERAISPWQTK